LNCHLVSVALAQMMHFKHRRHHPNPYAFLKVSIGKRRDPRFPMPDSVRQSRTPAASMSPQPAPLTASPLPAIPKSAPAALAALIAPTARTGAAGRRQTAVMATAAPTPRRIAPAPPMAVFQALLPTRAAISALDRATSCAGRLAPTTAKPMAST